MITGAEAIVKCLEEENVQVVFGYPGAVICPFYDSLIESNIRHVLVRHEQHAGHAAGGYARITGRPGVCTVTSGPGALNLITALGTAYMDSVPLVAITGQVSSELLGRDVFQEADITGAAESFTKYSYLVKRAEDLPRIIKEAFHIASTGRPGPVLIDVPVNVQNDKLSFSYPDTVDIRGYKPTVKGHTGQIKRFAHALNRAERPLFCVGGGIFASNGQETLRKVIEQLRMPVVTTMMGLGAVSTEHPLYVGMLGMHGGSHANRALLKTDLLVLLGARVSDRAVLAQDVVDQSVKVVHIDIDPAEIGKNVSTSLPIVGDIKTVLEQLLECDLKQTNPEWLDKLLEAKANRKQDLSPRQGTVNPRAFVRMLSEKLPDDAVYTADVGQNQIWSANHCIIRSGRFLTSGGMGTMGYSIPAAVGAKLAAPERTVVAVCGDGSFQMNMMELATMNQHDVPIKIVVMTNKKLGMVREIQKNVYHRREIGVDLSGDPEIPQIAKAYGIPARRVTDMEQAEEAVDEMLAMEGSCLLECIVDAEEASV